VPPAPRAAPAARGRARRRPRFRARALPCRPERRAPARADLDPAPARALGVRALALWKPVVARSGGGRDRLDPVLRPPPRTRCGAVLPRLRAVPDAEPVAARWRAARRGGGGPRRAPPGPPEPPPP